jgi:hypothetical protein
MAATRAVAVSVSRRVLVIVSPSVRGCSLDAGRPARVPAPGVLQMSARAATLIAMPKRKRSRKDKGSPKASTRPRGKVGRVCERCGHALAVGALFCAGCLGQGVSAAAQAEPAQSATPPAVFTLAPERDTPPLRYRTLAEWREAGRLPIGALDDHDQPESDATFPWASEVSVTGTASTFDVDGGPVQLPWNPYGD